jgi:DNA polymerase-3 subunit delta'
MAMLFPWLESDLTQLTARYDNGSLHHATILVGQSGIGKRQLATVVAERLLCHQPNSVFACGLCKACKLLAAGNHPDMYFISPEEKSRVVKISQIRELIEKISSTSMHDGNKVVVIEPADMMNMNAANALLKSLEEPTTNTYFILVADAMDRLLPTVRSRCHMQRIALPDSSLAMDFLQPFARNTDEASLALNLAGGRPLRARDLLDTDSAMSMTDMFDVLTKFLDGQASLSGATKILSKVSLTERILPLLELCLQRAVQLKLNIEKQAIAPVEAIALILHEKNWPINYHFDVIEACNKARGLLFSVANPNEQLLLEDVLIRLAAK